MEDNLFKEEWIDGNVMMSPRPSYNHMELEKTIAFELEKYFNKKCKVAIETSLFLTKEDVNEVKQDLVKLNELIKSKKSELVPDVAVYCDKNQVFRRGFLGVPQLVVEVVSPSNSTDDTIKKKQIYEKYGIPEYWIADPITKKLFIFELKEDKYILYNEYDFLNENIKSVRFEGLVLNIGDIDLINDDDEF